jgi:hypothetical protein
MVPQIQRIGGLQAEGKIPKSYDGDHHCLGRCSSVGRPGYSLFKKLGRFSKRYLLLSLLSLDELLYTDYSAS